MKDKKIPFKNYIFLALILIVSIITLIYFYMWYSKIEESKITTPIMNDYFSVINYNELSDYLVENKNVVVYVSELNDETRKFENKFRKIVNKYSLNNSMLYLNLTDENKKIVNNFKSSFNIESLPCIIFFDNEIVYDIYEISKNKYDLDLLVSYLKIKGVIND